LGRIEDPKKALNEDLNIIDDPAFRAIMVLEAGDPVHSSHTEQMDLFYQKFHRSIAKTVRHFEGSIAKQNNSLYLVSFTTSTNAILCALKIQHDFKYITPKLDGPHRNLGIGISAGVPVTEQDGFFAETIERATQLCEVVKDTIVITKAVKSLYENENRQAKIDPSLIRTLRPKEEHFMVQLMAFCKKTWNKEGFRLSVLAKQLGYSKAQLYRKIKDLTGKSPNTFLREYRLHKALKLLHEHFGNITEVAYETGFNSPAYFSKCFLETYGILPSKYAQLYEY
jgi:AraC-like DNA-binding protein